MRLHPEMVTSFTVYLKIATLYLLAMHGFTYFTLQPIPVKEDSPLLHCNEHCIVHWCMTKFN